MRSRARARGRRGRASRVARDRARAAARARRCSSCARSRPTSSSRTSPSSTTGAGAGATTRARGGSPRESLAEAFERLNEAGVGRGRARARRASRSRVELVLTAHPTEAARRTILAAHRRIAGLLAELDDPTRRARTAGRAGRGGDAALADRRGASRRPRVVDEIRHGPVVLRAEPAGTPRPTCCASCAAGAGRAGLLRFGTWIGGDLDGNPHAGPETIEEALERARQLARELLARRGPRARARPGAISSQSSSARSTTTSGSALPPIGERNTDEPYRRHLTCALGAARATATRRPTSCERRARRCSTRACAPAAAAGWPTAALAALRRRVEIFGLHVWELDAAPARERGPRARRAGARDARAPAARVAGAGTDAGARHADHLDDRPAATCSPPRGSRARPGSTWSRAAARDDRRAARRGPRSSRSCSTTRAARDGGSR